MENSEEKDSCWVREDCSHKTRASIREKVCTGLEVKYTDKDNNKYCILHYPNKTQNESQEFREKLKPLKNDFRAIHFPEKVNFNDLISSTSGSKTEIQRKINFRYATFAGGFLVKRFSFKKEVDFRNTLFQGAVDFPDTKREAGAKFNEVEFKEKALFNNAVFKNEVSFKSSSFHKKVFFQQAIFHDKVDFSTAVFEESSKIMFSRVTFKSSIDFTSAIFRGHVRFAGGHLKDNQGKTTDEFIKVFELLQENSAENKLLNLKDVQAELPERVHFQDVMLYPSWFVYIDARKLSFFNVDWKNSDGKLISLKKEIKKLDDDKIKEPKNIFKICLRQLAKNLEESDNFEYASNFRRMAFETEWLEISDKSNQWFNNILRAKKKIGRRFGYKKVDLLAPLKKALYIIRHFEFPHLFYRYLSYYGESWRTAVVILFLAIIIVFPIFYTITNFQVSPKHIPLEVAVEKCNIGEKTQPVLPGNPTPASKPDYCDDIKTDGLSFYDAILYSLTSATFQDVEYRRPISKWAEFWTSLEKIFAPLQTALLALAIRRKFMR